jgi:hypothetical protein
VQSVSKGFLELENVVFGEGVQDAIDVLVSEDCERHVGDPMFVYREYRWWNSVVRYFCYLC